MQRNILAVDDDPDTRDLIASYLARHDFHVSTAADGREMRRRLCERLADLITLDIMLPGEDDLAIMRDLRARSDIPIVIVSALDDAADRILALEMGADDYVAKPFIPRELMARIKTVLRRVQARGSGPHRWEKARQFDLRAISPYCFPHISRLLRRAEGRLAPSEGRRTEVLGHPQFHPLRADALKRLLDQFPAELHRQQRQGQDPTTDTNPGF